MRIEVQMRVKNGFPITAVVQVGRVPVRGPVEDLYIEEILNTRGKPISFIKLTQDEEAEILDRAAEIVDDDRAEASFRMF